MEPNQAHLINIDNGVYNGVSGELKIKSPGMEVDDLDGVPRLNLLMC